MLLMSSVPLSLLIALLFTSANTGYWFSFWVMFTYGLFFSLLSGGLAVAALCFASKRLPEDLSPIGLTVIATTLCAVIAWMVSLVIHQALYRWLGHGSYDAFAGFNSLIGAASQRALLLSPIQSAGVAALVAAVSLAFWHQGRKTPVSMLEDAKLETLGAAIRPHFFFNALNAVVGLIRSQPTQAENLVLDTADLFRDVMHQHDEKLITLAQELEVCQRYARIEQVRLGERLRLVWNADAALNAAQIPPFSIQPLIENAIRHGVESDDRGGEINIHITRNDQRLLVSVKNPLFLADEGAKLDQTVIKRANETRHHPPRRLLSNGIALKNIRARLWLMYAEDATLQLSSSPTEFSVLLDIPLEF